MSESSSSFRPAERPPYLLALAASLVVLAGYLLTLAPTVTFWDAGEFIGAVHILGIPHPPGTPLFLIIARAADIVIPFGATALRTNLLSAMISAASAGFLFLFVHQALARGAGGLDEAGARLFRVGGAFAATVVAAFVFTVWQNSNETEVYMVATFSIAVLAWLCWLWRRDRQTTRGAHILLLIQYILALALGNHLMALLAGPAVIGFMFHVLRTEPARDPAERGAQWSELAVMASLWVALIGVGTGSTGLVTIGLALWAVSTAYAWRSGSLFFALAALAVAAVGVSTYAILYIRAGLGPYVNEADPSTWDALLAVIRREQYPPRSPLDNPIYASGPDNPGRTMEIFGLQVLNYLQYFDWQFSASLQAAWTLLAPARLPFTLLFLGLGAYGAVNHRRWDRSSFWFLALLWLTTSIGLILYLNFKPGFSIGYEGFPDREMHEVRERDYFYIVSFVAWGLWSGLGIAAAFQALRRRLSDGPALAASPVLLLALVPFALNFQAASRRHGPQAQLARDFAYNLLQNVEPYGLLFTNGDNDTFPLWYLQEAEGVRQDVVNVNLSLVNTDWYIRQLRDNPARPYRPDSAAQRLYGPPVGEPPSCSDAQIAVLNEQARRSGRRPPDLARGRPACVHTLTDEQIALAQPRLLGADFVLSVGGLTHRYPAGTPLYVRDIMTLRIIQENLGRRPIYFSLTAGTGARMSLEAFVAQQAMAFKLFPDTVRAGGTMVPGLFGVMLDVERTRDLVWGLYRYGRLFAVDSLRLDPTNESIAANLNFPFLALGEAFRQLGRAELMLENYRRAAHLAPTPELAAFLRQFDQIEQNPLILGGDSARGDTGARDSGRQRR